MQTKLIPLIFLILIKHSLPFANWLDRKAEGWAWYDDKKRDQKKKQPVDVEAPLHSAVQKIKEIREGLEEKLSLAILDPSSANIRTYLAMQKEWMDRSAEFSQNWARVILNHPELDQTLATPVNQLGVQLQQNSRTERINLELRELGNAHGLLFVFDAQQSESIMMARIVSDFANTFEWTVIPVSLNGKGVSEYPNPQKNGGLVQNIGITATPALFTIEPISEQIRAVGTGLITLEELKENIIRQHKGRTRGTAW